MLAVVETHTNVDAEAALCGALMCENKLIDHVADRLSPEDFSEALFGRIYAAIVAEHGRGRAATPVTLRPYLADDPGIKEVGGLGFLGRLTGTGAHVLTAKDCATQIRELARQRRLTERLKDALASPDLPTLAAAVEEALEESSEDDLRQNQRTAAQAASRLVDDLGNHEHGVVSGIPPIDIVLGQLLPKQLVILAARPSMGKSAVASSYALGASGRGHGTLFVSLEMSEEELSERIISDLSFDAQIQIPYAALTNKQVTAEQGRQAARLAELLDRTPLEIADLATVTLARLNGIVRRTARRMAAKGQKLELVIVDYLQLIRADRKTKDRYEEVSEISRGLKALAKEHGVAVLALAQLSRKVEDRHDKIPHMADLRDSGQIEQDADSIMFLFRAEYYLQAEEPPPNHPSRSKWEAKMDEVRGKIDFIVAKRRRGPTGKSEGRFFGAFQAVRA